MPEVTFYPLVAVWCNDGNVWIESEDGERIRNLGVLGEDATLEQLEDFIKTFGYKPDDDAEWVDDFDERCRWEMLSYTRMEVGS